MARSPPVLDIEILRLASLQKPVGISKTWGLEVAEGNEVPRHSFKPDFFMCSQAILQPYAT